MTDLQPAQTTVDPTPDFSIAGQFVDDFSMPMSALGIELHDATRLALQMAITSPGKLVGVCLFELSADRFAEKFRKDQSAVLSSWHRDTHPELPGTFRIATFKRVLRNVPQVERVVYVSYEPTA